MELFFEYQHLSTKEYFKVKLTIDEVELARELSARAYVNKNGKSSAMDKSIKCEVVERGGKS